MPPLRGFDYLVPSSVLWPLFLTAVAVQHEQLQTPLLEMTPTVSSDLQARRDQAATGVLGGGKRGQGTF